MSSRRNFDYVWKELPGGRLVFDRELAECWMADKDAVSKPRIRTEEERVRLLRGYRERKTE